MYYRPTLRYMRRISVPVRALALAGGVALGVLFVSSVVFRALWGDDDQSPRAQTSSESLYLGPRFIHLGPMDPWVVVEAEVVGDLFVRYVVSGLVRSPVDGRVLKRVLKRVGRGSPIYAELRARPAGAESFIGGMSGFLDRYRFGEKGRPMVVHALDGQGCFAWTAGYDGLQKMWVRARPPLTGWGPIFYRFRVIGSGADRTITGPKLPPAAGPVVPQPCLSPAVLANARVAAGLR